MVPSPGRPGGRAARELAALASGTAPAAKLNAAVSPVQMTIRILISVLLSIGASLLRRTILPGEPFFIPPRAPRVRGSTTSLDGQLNASLAKPCSEAAAANGSVQGLDGTSGEAR